VANDKIVLYLGLIFDKNGATSLRNFIPVSVISWNQFSEITYVGEVVELAEADVEI